MADNNQTQNYISLQEATKYCAYAQEYLSLRARQGKLKAAKFGRNWVTTKEWLEEYLAQVEEYNNNFKVKKVEKVKKEILVPENLPVGELKLVLVKPLYFQISEILQQVIKKIIFSPAVRFGFVYGITLVLIIAGIILEKDSLKEVMVGLSAPIKESFVSIYGDIENEFSKLGRKINEDEIYSAAIYGTVAIYQEYFQWLGDIVSPYVLAISELAEDIWQSAKAGYIVADNFIEKKLSVVADSAYKLSQFFNRGEKGIKEVAFGVSERIAKLFSKPAVREGMVVVPSTEKDEEVKEKIKAAFSDEVEVKPKDKESGIIVPIFRAGRGEDYMYILVPIKER